LVWENVPGTLSSNEGEDFGKIINTMVGVEFNSNRLVWRNEGICFGRDSMLEWAVLDGQWFGVAQRRRRLFIVLDTGDWESRESILLKSKSLRGNPEKSRKKKKESTDKSKSGIGNAIKSKLTSCFDMQAIGLYGDNDIASTLKARDYKDATDLIVEDDYTCAIAGNIIGRNPETRSGGNGNGFNENVMYTLTGNDHHAIAYKIDESKIIDTNVSSLPVPDSHVRRLTPLECERLQGFPDNWTLVDDKTAFSRRINALGRSMAVPVIQWIGVQLEKSIVK